MVSKDASLLDEQLAAGQNICDRLCLVRRLPPAAEAVTPAPIGKEVAAYDLWPALKFDSYREFTDQVAMVAGLSKQAAFKILIARNRLIRELPHKHPMQEHHGVAYLIGLGSILLVPRNKVTKVVEMDSVYVFDIWRHAEEIDGGEGHCGTEEFRNAYDLAMRRMEDSMEMTVVQSVVEEDEGENKKAAAAIASARKTISNAERSPMKKRHEKMEGEQGRKSSPPPEGRGRRRSMSTDSRGIKTYSNVEYSPTRMTREKTNRALETVREHSPISIQELPPVKMVECSGDPPDDGFSSPDKSKGGESTTTSKKLSYSDDESQAGCFDKGDKGDGDDDCDRSSAGKTARSPPSTSTRKSTGRAPSPLGNVHWEAAWEQMKSQGWSYTQGKGLVPWYWLHPTCKDMRKTKLLKEKQEGSDYFSRQEDLKHYARIHLGWVTEDSVQRRESPKDVDLAGRVKKRKRGCQKKLEQKKEPSNENTNVKSRAKKPVPLCGQNSMSSKQSESPASPQSEESRFSECTKSNSSDQTFSCSDAKQNMSKTKLSAVRGRRVNLEVKKTRKKRGTTIKKLEFSQGEMSQGEMTNDGESTRRSPRSNSGGSQRSTSVSSSSKSSSDQSSLDVSYQILASRSAWLLLRDRFGFIQHDVYHCYPGRENRPGKESVAEEGTHYFPSLESLRKHLCAYGLPEIKPSKSLSKEEEHDLERWVRHANMVNVRDAEIINPDELGNPLGYKRAWTMLTKLGMVWKSGYYLYPNSDPSKAPFKFEQQKQLFVHLARFGIPRIAGIQPNGGLSRDDRLALDLFIADTEEVKAFERITPGSEDVNEITPRRARKAREDPELASKPKVVRRSSVSPKKTLKHRSYQMEFNDLSLLRTFPAQLMSSKEALSMLVDNYNFRVLHRDGQGYYCLPNVALAEGEDSDLGRDYFKTVQEMRENLCGYGLPSIAKGTKLDGAAVKALESWVRCAHMTAGRDGSEGGMPNFVHPKPKQVRAWLKGLGYTFRDNFNMVLLPGVTCHGSELGIDCFNKLIDLFNHLARFGLTTDECEISEEDQSILEVYVASVATFDVSKRIKCDAPIVKRSPIAEQESAATMKPTAMAFNTAEDVPNATIKVDPASISIPPAVVVEECDQDSPQPPPPKKSRMNIITDFFASTANVIKTHADSAAATFSPSKTSQPLHHAEHSSPAPSSLTELTASCLDKKGDDEVEACFADLPLPNLPCHMNDEGCGDLDWDVPKVMGNSTSNLASEFNTPKHTSAHQTMEQEVSTSPTFDDENGHNEKDACFTSQESPKAPESVAQDLSNNSRDQQGDDISSTSSAKHTSTAAPKPTEVLSPLKRRLGSLVKQSNVGDSSLALFSPKKKSRSLPKNEENEAVQPQSLGETNREPKNGYAKSAHPQPSRAKEHMAPPDKEQKVLDKLETCQMVLHASFKKHQLSKSSSTSVVSSMEDDIKDFMTKSIETGTTQDGMTLPSPGFMYICGGPGTGKTTAVASCADEMKKWAKRSGHGKPCFCIINMASSQTSSNCKGGIMKAMLAKMASALGIDKDGKLQTFEEEFKEKTLVLVLDEIDMFFKQHGGIGETWFKTLVDWAENKELGFSMIGISNCVNDSNATRVRELGHFPLELVFSPYQEEDILAILEERVGKKVVDHKALQLISRRVAASSGDARRALEITSNAVGKCMDILSEEKLSTVMTESDEESMLPLVKLPHMMRAIREGMPMRHVDIISGLPQAAKVVLCIAVSLSQVWGPTAEISISQLRKYCVEATQHAILDDLHVGHIMGIVTMLIDSGLLVTGNSGRFDPQDVDVKLKIGVQLDDVEIALEKSLYKDVGFYRSLVQYVRSQKRTEAPLIQR